MAVLTLSMEKSSATNVTENNASTCFFHLTPQPSFLCPCTSGELQSQLLGLLSLNGPLPALSDVLGFDAHDAATPSPSVLKVVVELGLEVVDQGVQVLLILRLHGSDGNARGRFLVDQLAQAALALDDAVRHILLAAQCRKPAHQLDRIHIMGNHHQLCHLVFHQGGHMVQAILQHLGLLGLHFLSLLLLFGHLHESCFLCLLGLRHVLLAKLQHICRLVLVHGHVELVDGRGHLQSHQHDALLTLQPDVLGPFHKSGEITFRLNVTTQAVVARSLLEQRVLLGLFLVC